MISKKDIWENIDKFHTQHLIHHSYSNLYNFEKAVEDQLKLLEEAERSLQGKIDALNSKLTGIETENGTPCEADIEIMNEMGGLYNELNEIREQHYSIWEMIFVNLFRTMEVAIKTQLSTAYSGVDLSQLYKWEIIKEFFRTKGINIGTFNDYPVVNQIRLINNDIKHSKEISNNVLKQNIPEFANLQFYDSASLKKYYFRVKDVPKRFMESLANEIIKNLYEFDDNRLAEIAKKFKRRMDNPTMLKLIDKMKSELPKKDNKQINFE